MCQVGMEGETVVRMEVNGSPSWGSGSRKASWRRGAPGQEAGGGGSNTEGEGRSGPMYRDGAAGEGGGTSQEEEIGAGWSKALLASERNCSLCSE